MLFIKSAIAHTEAIVIAMIRTRLHACCSMSGGSDFQRLRVADPGIERTGRARGVERSSVTRSLRMGWPVDSDGKDSLPRPSRACQGRGDLRSGPGPVRAVRQELLQILPEGLDLPFDALVAVQKLARPLAGGVHPGIGELGLEGTKL